MQPPSNVGPIDAHDSALVSGSSPIATADGVVLHGIAASPGIAIGSTFLHRPDSSTGGQVAQKRAHDPDPNSDPAGERAAARAALVAAAEELRALAEQVRRDIGKDEADIFVAQALMLDDPTILERAEELIDHDARDASSALYLAAEEQAEALAALADPLFQARAADVRDAAQRAISHVGGTKPQPSLADGIAQRDTPVLVVAGDLTPSDTAHMRPDRVLAIALAEGSATSHAAILARAMGIPAVVGLGQQLFDALYDGELLIVDGTTGVVTVRPSLEQQARARERAHDDRLRRSAQQRQRDALLHAPGMTRDGHRIAVLANIGSEADAGAAASAGAEGIGLLRTEFLFAERAELPDEAAQADLYTSIIEAFGSPRYPIIIRTLDAGADKPLPALASYVRDITPEENPALGVRGVRLQLRFPELFRVQLRGILLAAVRTQANLRLMLPMVATLDELRAGRRFLAEARDDLAQRGVHLNQTIPLGIMVETPAAALTCDILATEAAFFSIGTNDLTQYIMAADRLNPRLAPLNDPVQPAVLHAIARIVAVAHQDRRHVGVCGEMAGSPTYALLLAGLGVTELSMTPGAIPAVKEALAARTLDELHLLSRQALAARTAEEVDEILNVP